MAERNNGSSWADIRALLGGAIMNAGDLPTCAVDPTHFTQALVHATTPLAMPGFALVTGRLQLTIYNKQQTPFVNDDLGFRDYRRLRKLSFRAQLKSILSSVLFLMIFVVVFNEAITPYVSYSATSLNMPLSEQAKLSVPALGQNKMWFLSFLALCKLSLLALFSLGPRFPPWALTVVAIGAHFACWEGCHWPLARVGNTEEMMSSSSQEFHSRIPFFEFGAYWPFYALGCCSFVQEHFISKRVAQVVISPNSKVVSLADFAAQAKPKPSQALWFNVIGRGVGSVLLLLAAIFIANDAKIFGDSNSQMKSVYGIEGVADEAHWKAHVDCSLKWSLQSCEPGQWSLQSFTLDAVELFGSVLLLMALVRVVPSSPTLFSRIGENSLMVHIIYI
jgi:hypothetical protein